jgi:hypothetical protein
MGAQASLLVLDSYSLGFAPRVGLCSKSSFPSTNPSACKIYLKFIKRRRRAEILETFTDYTLIPFEQLLKKDGKGGAGVCIRCLV